MAQPANTSRRQPNHGPTGFVIEVVFGALMLTIGAWFLGVMIEIGGSYTFWDKEGELHAKRMVTEDLGYIDAAPRSVLVDDTAAFARLLLGWVAAPFDFVGIERWYQHAVASAAEPASGSQGGLRAALQVISLEASRACVIAKYVALDTALRLSMAVFAMPAFVLACLLGAVDGLVRRDLRRWGGGRESSFVYHRAKRLATWSITGGFAIYLSWPFGGFSPAYMVLVFTALVAFSLSTTLATFKKYL